MRDDIHAELFEEVVHEYKDRVFNICYRLLGNYHDAEDIAQEIFIKSFRALRSFRYQSTLSTCIYRIAVNTCKNSLNSASNRHRLPDESFSPEIRHAIQSALNTLPPRQKIVVVPRDIEGKSYQEISDITGLRLGTVKSRLARAHASTLVANHTPSGSRTVNCRETEKQLSPYIDNELDERTVRSVEKHLQACQECPRKLAALKDRVAQISSLPKLPAPDGFMDRVYARLNTPNRDRL